MGDRVTVDVDCIRQQQIVHVTAVTGDIDDLVALRDPFQRVEVTEDDTVVEAVPQPRQRRLHEANEGVRVVSGDLLGIAASLQERLPARDLLLSHFLRHGGAHRPRA